MLDPYSMRHVILQLLLAEALRNGRLVRHHISDGPTRAQYLDRRLQVLVRLPIIAALLRRRFIAYPECGRRVPPQPVPTLVFDDQLDLTLGGKTVDLRWAALGPQDPYLTVHYGNVLMAVDVLHLRAIAFSDFPFASAEGTIEFVERLEADLHWDIYLYGHTSGSDFIGTRDDARQYREHLHDLMAAIRAGRQAGLEDNSDEMVAAVRTDLEPAYSTWRDFDRGLAANIRGVIRWWSE